VDQETTLLQPVWARCFLC